MSPRFTVGRDGQIRLAYTDNNIEGHKRLIRTSSLTRDWRCAQLTSCRRGRATAVGLTAAPRRPPAGRSTAPA
jgi:hypothetical protein